MQVPFQCPSCQTPLQAEASQEMVEACCPKCGTRFMGDTVDFGSGWVVGVFSKRLDQGRDGVPSSP